MRYIKSPPGNFRAGFFASFQLKPILPLAVAVAALAVAVLALAVLVVCCSGSLHHRSNGGYAVVAVLAGGASDVVVNTIGRTNRNRARTLVAAVG